MSSMKKLINDVEVGRGKIVITAMVDKVVQTGGPTVFVVNDGTGNLSLKGFIGPGQRAYPEIEGGMVVKATVIIGEFQGETEGEIVKIEQIEGSAVQAFLKSVEKIERERAKVEPIEFLVKNKILDKMHDRFIEAAFQIRLAIIQNRPIIVRHHNDCDGYSSGFALERAILPLIVEQHGSEKSAWEYFVRAPCSAPFYEIDDSIRDTASSLRAVAKFSNKMPLIVIADNGSGPEDLMAIKQGKVHGADFIVVDHHGFDKDVISKEVLAHINPHLIDESGSELSAGMLCVELARFIRKDTENIIQIAAMAGYADKIDLAAPETMKAYLKSAEKEGYGKTLLSDISLVIDYVSTKLRFMECREYIEVLFGEPKDKQKALVNLMAPYIKDLDAKGLAIGKSNSSTEVLGKITFQTIDVNATFPGFGFFPKPGRSVSLIHDNLQKEKKVTSLVTAGIMPTAITMRATNEADFSVHGLIEFLKKKTPDAFISGGGHKNAGAISFLPYKKDEVVEGLKEFISNL